MLIRVVREVIKERTKKLSDGSKIREEYVYSQLILKREISELREFEEVIGSKGKRLKKRCVAYLETGPALVAHSFAELRDMKTNQFKKNAAGFTL